MPESEMKSLIPRPPAAVERAAVGTNRVLSGMVEETLALANKEPSKPAKPRFRIGDHEWCEPDYRQILIWAEALAIEPREVIERLQHGKKPDYTAWAETIFSDGRIVKLNWDSTLLPMENFEWAAGLEITHLSLVAGPSTRLNWDSKLDLVTSTSTGDRGLSLPLSKLTHLRCDNMGLSRLEVSEAPELQELICYDNQLTTLDLTHVPKLKSLNCHTNQLGELDLSQMQELKKLSCGANRIAHLDFSRAISLRTLSCGENQLCKLNLSNVPNLTDLYCAGNCLGELDLSKLSTLVSLNCWSNQLVDLDLSGAEALQKLFCYENLLKVLDIRPLRFLRLLQYDVRNTRLLRRPEQNPVDRYEP